MKHNHYHKPVKHLETIDVYRVLKLFGVTDPCLQHAIKKLLCAGQRGIKPVANDVQEAIDSLTRWQEMLAEDALFIQDRMENAPKAPASIQWPESESRIDVIGQNGNDGAPYSIPKGATHYSHELGDFYRFDALGQLNIWCPSASCWAFCITMPPADLKPITLAADEMQDDSPRMQAIGQNGNDGAAYCAKESREKVQATNIKLPDGEVVVLVSDPDNMRPEGATHFHEEMGAWLQLRGQEYWFWMENKWVFHAYKRYADGKNIFAIVNPSK